MRSTLNPVLTLVPLALLAACSPDLVSPLDANPDVSAASASSIPALSLRDSVIVLGDSTIVTSVSASVSARTAEPRTRSRTAVLRFRSRDDAVASVDANGTVRGRKIGTTVLVLEASGRARDSVLIRVVTQNTVPAPDSAPLGSLGPTSGGFKAPELPRRSVNVSVPQVTGRTIRVAAGDAAALNAALSAAVGGDEIVLANGAQYIGNFTLPVHSGSAPVILRSETVPTAGVRVTPTSSRSLARLVTTNTEPALKTATSAGGWSAIGVVFEQRTAPDVVNYGIVRIGTGTESQLTEFANRIVFDRVLITAGETGQTRRCLSFNGADIAVVNSWLAECHSKGFDTQAVAGWNSPGPFLIENNHMEASGEHVVFGGGDPRILNLSPSDITIRRNYMFRPMSWAGGRWMVKNIFELKHARRVLFENNVLENNWADGQNGSAILFQAISQDATAPWTTIQDITVRNNVLKNSKAGIVVLSRREWNGMTPAEPSKRILFENNLLLKVGTDPVSGAGDGRFTTVMGDVEDFTLVGNTMLGDGVNAAMVFNAGPLLARLVVSRNVIARTAYGFFGTATSEGEQSLAKFAPGYVFTGNVMTGRPTKFYNTQTATPATLTDADFVSPSTMDYTIRSQLPYAFSEGRLVGVNGTGLRTALAGVIVAP